MDKTNKDNEVEQPLWRRLGPFIVSLIERAIEEGIIKEK